MHKAVYLVQPRHCLLGEVQDHLESVSRAGKVEGLPVLHRTAHCTWKAGQSCRPPSSRPPGPRRSPRWSARPRTGCPAPWPAPWPGSSAPAGQDPRLSPPGLTPAGGRSRSRSRSRSRPAWLVSRLLVLSSCTPDTPCPASSMTRPPSDSSSSTSSAVRAVSMAASLLILYCSLSSSFWISVSADLSHEHIFSAR